MGTDCTFLQIAEYVSVKLWHVTHFVLFSVKQQTCITWNTMILSLSLPLPSFNGLSNRMNVVMTKTHHFKTDYLIYCCDFALASLWMYNSASAQIASFDL